MSKIKLGYISTIRKGTKIEQNEQTEQQDDNVIRYLQIEDLRSDDNIKFCEASKKYVVASTKDIIIAWDGANAGTIGFGLQGAIGSTLATIRLNEENLDARFVGLLLRSKFNYLRNNCTGATIPHVNRKSLDAIDVPLLPLEVQHRIIKKVFIVTDLLEMRKQQLAALDNLIKSTFHVMFGDPVTNEKGWQLKPIKDFSRVKIGPFGSLLHVEDYIHGGFPLVNPSHIVNGKVIPDMRLTLTNEKYSDLQSYHMIIDDIVVARRGEIGRCAVVSDEGYLCGTGSMFIRIEKEYLPLVLQHIISSETVRTKLEHQSVGVTMKNLNAGTISNFKVPMIPITIQTQFAEIVTKIEEQKSLLKMAINETQYLFDSLMSEYFD